MVGAADLDRYGSWQTTQDYGPVWFPYAAAPDWAPYRDGYWADIGGWGPTWVDSAPWGYAPFHYGRWAFIGGRWGWCPGGYVARPVWAPALVAWYGGPGWGVGYTNGRPLYGWVPLGWREPYYPGWRRCSFNCWARFNRPHGIDVSQRASAPPTRHVNLAVPGALSAVPATSLAGHTSVRSNLVNVPAQLASSAPPMRTIPSVGYEQRQIPGATPGMSTLPPAASTLCDGAEAGCHIVGSLAPASRSRESERIRASCERRGTGRDDRSARAGEGSFAACATAARCRRAGVRTASDSDGGDPAAAATDARSATEPQSQSPGPAGPQRWRHRQNRHGAARAGTRRSAGTGCAGIGRAAAECTEPGCTARRAGNARGGRSGSAPEGPATGTPVPR